MAEISDAQVAAVMAFNEQVLDMLVDSFRLFDAKDRAEGAADGTGALGGVSELAARAVELGPATESTLLAMAVQRLAKEAGG